VTVVVADVVDYDYGQTQPILAGAVSGEEDHLTLPNTSAGRASAISPRKEAAKRLPPQEETTNRPRWSRRRMIIVVALVVLAVLAGLAIGRAIIRSNYYVAEYNGMVSIVRGIQGSLLGMSLHEPYLVGCLNARNELSLISYSQSGSHLDCRLLQLQDLRPAERAQVQAGLPAGTLDGAIGQLRQLSANSLLPPCPPPRATSPPGPPAATTSGTAQPSVTAPTTSSIGTPPSGTTPTSTAANTTPAAPATTSPTTTSQTVTALPPPPPQPGIDCRAAA
jgi:PPM family protein phosphatase